MLKQIFLSKLGKIFWIIFFILILGIFLFQKEKNSSSQTQYQGKNMTDYHILLKPNSFYDTNTLTKNSYYVSNAIDKIKINFQYFSNEKANNNFSYYYKITTRLEGQIDHEVVWKKEKTIEQKEMTNQKSISIHKIFSFRYDSYLDLVKKFEETYHLSLDSVLYVRLSIHSVNSNIHDYIELEIPINEEITYIQMKSKITSKKKKLLHKNTMFSIISIFILTSCLLFFLWSKKKKKTSASFPYYHEIIIQSLSEPKIENYPSLQLTNMNDLICLAHDNNTHIIEFDHTYYLILDHVVYLFHQ